jgi:hypothetical protein
VIDSRGYPYLAAIKADSNDAELVWLGEERLLDGGWLSHGGRDINLIFDCVDIVVERGDKVSKKVG